MTMGEELRLPDHCAVRLLDLDPGVGGLIAVDEDGFVNIYINARLSRDGQLRALRHELRHYERGDLYSDADIREVERLADGPVVLDITGAVVEDPAPAFDPEALRAVGRGLYRPTGKNEARAAADLARLRGLLTEAVGMYDVLQRPPLLPAERLAALAGGLCPEDLAFISWQAGGAALRFSREDGGRLHGAVFYDRHGRPDSALAAFELDDARVTVDLRRRQGRLDIHGIRRERGEWTEKVY